MFLKARHPQLVYCRFPVTRKYNDLNLRRHPTSRCVRIKSTWLQKYNQIGGWLNAVQREWFCSLAGGEWPCHRQWQERPPSWTKPSWVQSTGATNTVHVSLFGPLSKSGFKAIWQSMEQLWNRTPLLLITLRSYLHNKNPFLTGFLQFAVPICFSLEIKLQMSLVTLMSPVALPSITGL